jgi:hypothetical protein
MNTTYLRNYLDSPFRLRQICDTRGVIFRVESGKLSYEDPREFLDDELKGALSKWEYSIVEDLTAAMHLEEFIRELGVREYRWSHHNISRLLRATGERPERVEEMRSLLGDLGTGDRHRIGDSRMGYCYLIGAGGVWDHVKMWGRDRFPCIFAGHPYSIDDEQREMLAQLAQFPGLRVGVDDRPSYYGHGTHHVRVELTERRQPWKPYPSTVKTRSVKRAARKAFAEEFDS